MSKYLELLNLLLSFGPKLPGILAAVQRIVDCVSVEASNIREILGGGLGATPIVPSAAEVEAKSKLIALASEGGVSGPLDRILAFLEQYPQLVTLILTLLAK